MKKLLFVTIALVAMSSIPAVAADMRARPAPVYKAAPAAMVAAYNWTGFYLGGQAGYQWSAEDHTVASTGTTTVGPFPFDSKGAVYGGHAGFNWQTGQWVFGIEGDYEGSSVDGFTAVAPFGLASTFAFDQKWQASLRGRLGWAFWDRGMVYATGGVAWAKFNNTGIFDVLGVGPGPQAETWSDTVHGWTIGAGVEWALLPNWNNWTGRVEYRYTDFDGFSIPSTTVPGATVTTDNLKFHTVRIGLSYRFGDWGKGPMVARY